MINKLKNLLVAKKVLINFDNQKAFRGILYKVEKDFIELKQAELLEPNINPVSVSGSVIILKSKIDFIQILEN